MDTTSSIRNVDGNIVGSMAEGDIHRDLTTFSELQSVLEYARD